MQIYKIDDRMDNVLFWKDKEFGWNQSADFCEIYIL